MQKSLNRLNWVFRQLKLESDYGKKALDALKPYQAGDEAKLRTELLKISGVVECLRANSALFDSFNRLFMELRNISAFVDSLKSSLVLQETGFFEIKNFAILASKIIDLAKEENILPDFLGGIDLKPVIELLNPDPIITRSFYVHEVWSDKLKKIRDSKRKIESLIVSTDDFSEKENLRAKRLAFVAQERDEELCVRKKLSLELAKYEDRLERLVKNIGFFELLLAKAELASANSCCVPTIYDSGSKKAIVVEAAIEPEIAESINKNGVSFTPVSIEMQSGVTLLTGANMGGKTVALTTLALNAELIRFGFFPFAKKMSMKIPDFVEFIAGDGQDLKGGLSSFGAEIKSLANLLNKLDSGSGIIFCDEFGRSTNPFEGSRFVQALCDRLQSSSSYAIIATHYDGIKAKGASYYRARGLKIPSDKVEQVNLAFAELSEFMDYSLVKVSAKEKVPREALDVARLLGLPKDFIEKLKELY